MIVVAEESPRQPDVLVLLAASDAESAARYPSESRYGVGVEALEDVGCRFFVAREGGVAVGCGGVVTDGAGTAEVKRMFVAESARCRGLARRIIEAIEQAARGAGCRVLRLETGINSHAALALYGRLGFVACARFGDYPEDRLSVFMEKPL